MVPKAGLEPARAVAHYPLKIACLPNSTTSARIIATSRLYWAFEQVLQLRVSFLLQLVPQ